MRAPAEEVKGSLAKESKKNVRGHEGSCRGEQRFSCKGGQQKTFGPMRAPAEEVKGSLAKESKKNVRANEGSCRGEQRFSCKGGSCKGGQNLTTISFIRR
jgi:hypothetical protein